MNDREIELQKDRAGRVDRQRRMNANAPTFKTLPPESVPAPRNSMRNRIVKVTAITSHPDISKTLLQVEAIVRIRDDVPEEFKLYRGCVGMIRHMYFVQIDNANFVAFVVSFKSTTPAADAMMQKLNATKFGRGVVDLSKDICVPPGTLLILLESCLEACTMGTSLSRIGDPETRKRKHTDCEEAQEQHKQQGNVAKQPCPGKDAVVEHESDDAESEEEESGLRIDESDDEDVDL